MSYINSYKTLSKTPEQREQIRKGLGAKYRQETMRDPEDVQQKYFNMFRNAAMIQGETVEEASLSSVRPKSRGDAVGDLDPHEIGSRLMSDLQKELGLTKEQAAGFVGNLAHETGDFKFMQEIDPVVKGSRGGYGFAQWTGPRRKAFEAWAKENDMNISGYDANLGFLLHEINNTSEGRFMDALRGASTVEDSARIVSNKYLRPGKPHLNSRIFRAAGYYENA